MQVVFRLVVMALAGLVIGGCRWNFDVLDDGGVRGDADGNNAEVCSAAWCWDDAPAVEQRTLRAVGGSSATDVWAVGDGGTIRRWDGASWRVVPSPTSDALRAIDVVSATDVTIAAAAGVLWHYDGATWTQRLTPTGSSASALWRDATGSLWAAGENGSLSTDAAVLTPHPLRVAATALHGASASSVWHAGVFNTASRWNGSSWSHMLIGDYPRGVRALASGEAIFAGASIWHCTTTPACTQQAAGANAHGLWGSSDTDIWSVGVDGTLLHFDGGSWQPVSAPNSMNYVAVWGAATDDIWAVGEAGAIIHYDGQAWTSHGTDTAPTLGVRAIWVGTDSDRWLLSSANLVHDDGTQRVTAMLPAAAVPGDELEGSATNDVFAPDVGNGGVLRWDGTSWTSEMVTLAQPRGLAASATEVLVSNLSGQIMQRQSGSWTEVYNMAGTELHGLCISELGDALAVGRFGDSARRNGAAGTWVDNATPSGRFLVACDYADGTNEAWATGGDAVLAWTPSSWKLVPAADVGSGQSWLDVLAVSTSEVYLAGGNGRIYRFDGTSWREEATPTGDFLDKLARSETGTLYAVSSEAGVLRRR